MTDTDLYPPPATVPGGRTRGPASPARAAVVRDLAARARLADLLVRVGGGDRAAFGAVYTLTSARVFAICLRVCGNRPAAEDAMHDVYITVWRRAGTWDATRGAPLTWIGAIARNRSIDWRRAQAIRRATGLDEADAVRDPAPDAEARLLSAERDRTLHSCLGDLDARHRDAIRDAFFGGATYAELAERRGVPLGTMKSWIRRGLAQLHERLLRLELDDPRSDTPSG